jgi:ATP-dependent Lon protease
VSTAHWKLGKFRSALDFYLNHSFDLSKVLTFVRYYTRHLSDRLDSVTISSSSSLEDKQRAFDSVFGEVETLVDLDALFSFLVEKTGSK